MRAMIETATYASRLSKVNSIAFSPAGQSLYAAGADGTVWTWQTAEKNAVSRRQFPVSGDPGQGAALNRRIYGGTAEQRQVLSSLGY